MNAPLLQVHDRDASLATQRRLLVQMMVLALGTNAVGGVLLATGTGGWPALVALYALVLPLGMLRMRRGNVWPRVRARIGVAAMSRDRDAVMAKLLQEGDVPGARRLVDSLLVRGRPFEGFHAVHVLLHGLVRTYEGQSEEAVEVLSRTLASGWFESRDAVAWCRLGEWARVMAWLQLGKLHDARIALTEKPALHTAALLVEAYEARWPELIAEAARLLDQDATPEQTRPLVAALGLHAASQTGDRTRVGFEAVLAETPLGPGERALPALQPFLPA